ncbi:MAG: class E sortase [Microbacterium sp. SCN 70-200]|uniref:class E sortase n=1 Tax=unclassified Microbacterium TaxID=2609290 RepID=UPI00086D52DD|nr:MULTISPECIES: class E sortase [unclassified Microbacterium]MBN9215125.1 class E sortase [Microbacterium sp.]ODT42550.1 MAG: class E sortase [Microbacterium sp. SCN 70-200]OJV80107.1 MAG: class E sortase [Microbacterium sp. 70-16]
MGDISAPAETRRNSRPRRRTSVIGVLGEVLITLGVVALLYVSWQMWIGDAIIGAEKHAEASALSQSWTTPAPTDDTTPSPTDDPAATPSATDEPTDPANTVIPVSTQPAHGTQFGVMFIPRFGSDWQFTIAAGTSRKDILDQGEIGHYKDTAMPGEIGNTVYAAHRWTSGAPFDPIDQLVIGDAIVIQTADGWYTYRFRTLEYVQDTQVEVLLPVPQQVGVAADGRYLTLTSCAPKLNMLERIIAYAVFEDFTPTADGPPASLDAPTQGASA